MTGPDSDFRVPFNNRPFKTPRKIRVVCIGSGFAGLTLAYKISHELKLEHVLDFQIYERQHRVGGTWLANTYPGLTCDVPIHIYTLPWAPKHDWSRFMATGEEIRKYVFDTAKKFDLNRFITFNSIVKDATWDQSAGKWNLTIELNGSTIHDSCDVLIGASGTQSTPIKPDIEGLDTFKGTVVHTGSWNAEIDVSGKRVGVIGNGSSGIQAFGALQPKAAHITHYIRAATWISMNYMAQFTPNGANFSYTDEDKARYKDPAELYAYRLKLERVSNGIFKNLVFNETCQDVKANFKSAIEKLMRTRLHDDPDLVGKLVPSYQPWCRRLTPGDAYLDALQADNAALIDDPITEITESGIVTKTINEHQDLDVIVLATGFRNTRVPPWIMKGRGGVLLSDLWKDNPDSYISIAAPEMPNYFTIGCGPNFTIANGPVLSAFGFMAEYILKWCVKIASEGVKSTCVRADVVQAWNVYIQEIMQRTAWNDSGCGSWYKKKKEPGKGAEYGDSKGENESGSEDGYRTGITAIYPGSMNHFREMLAEIRGEDFEIEYLEGRNRWAQIVGNGLTERDVAEDGDLAPYLERTFKGENMMSDSA